MSQSATKSFLRRLTYAPQLQAVARALRLRGVLRNWYYRLALPPDGVVPLYVGGLAAQFRAQTPYELRMIEGWSEKNTFERLVPSVRDGDIVYDIGANIGLYTVLMAKVVGRQGQVVAVEPDSGNYRKLEQNVKLNGLTNVRLYRKALGDKETQAKLYRGADITDSTLRLHSGVPENQQGYEVVDVVTGDAMRLNENLPVPRLVKIDVEGYEYAVLQGLRRTLADAHCQVVCCEVHPASLQPQTESDMIVSFLQSLGFNRTETDAVSGFGLLRVIAYKGAS